GSQQPQGLSPTAGKGAEGRGRQRNVAGRCSGTSPPAREKKTGLTERREIYTLVHSANHEDRGGRPSQPPPIIPTPQGGDPMLVLARRIGEEIIIAGNIRVSIVAVQGDRVRLGITAPQDVTVDRREVHDRRRRMAAGFRHVASDCPRKGRGLLQLYYRLKRDPAGLGVFPGGYLPPNRCLAAENVNGFMDSGVVLPGEGDPGSIGPGRAVG